MWIVFIGVIAVVALCGFLVGVAYGQEHRE